MGDQQDMFRLRLTQIAPEDPASGAYDPWHRLYLVDSEGTEILLIENPLDGEELSTWFMDNMQAIQFEQTPFPQEGGNSLARSVDLSWDLIVATVEELTGSFEMFLACRDVLVHYRQRHSLRSGASGMEFPDIIFGVGRNGPEVSCDAGPGWTWRYSPIDFQEFYEWLPLQIAKGEYMRHGDS